jgi:hypothetical protein
MYSIIKMLTKPSSERIASLKSTVSLQKGYILSSNNWIK